MADSPPRLRIGDQVYVLDPTCYALHGHPPAGAMHTLEEILAYAPHAAWLSADDIAKALRGIASLARLAHVQAVEPELLMVRAFK